MKNATIFLEALFWSRAYWRELNGQEAQPNRGV